MCGEVNVSATRKRALGPEDIRRFVVRFVHPRMPVLEIWREDERRPPSIRPDLDRAILLPLVVVDERVILQLSLQNPWLCGAPQVTLDDPARGPSLRPFRCRRRIDLCCRGRLRARVALGRCAWRVMLTACA